MGRSLLHYGSSFQRLLRGFRFPVQAETGVFRLGIRFFPVGFRCRLPTVTFLSCYIMSGLLRFQSAAYMVKTP